MTESITPQRKDIKSCIQIECRVCHVVFYRSKYRKAKDTICRSCSCKERNKPGAGHPSWKGGSRDWIDGRFNYDRDGFHWKEQRLECLKRDQYTCQACGMNKDEGGRIVPHHIVPYETSHSHSPTNLIALCDTCHWNVHQFLATRPDDPVPFTPQAPAYDPEWNSRPPEFVIDMGPAPF